MGHPLHPLLGTTLDLYGTVLKAVNTPKKKNLVTLIKRNHSLYPFLKTILLLLSRKIWLSLCYLLSFFRRNRRFRTSILRFVYFFRESERRFLDCGVDEVSIESISILFHPEGSTGSGTEGPNRPVPLLNTTTKKKTRTHICSRRRRASNERRPPTRSRTNGKTSTCGRSRSAGQSGPPAGVLASRVLATFCPQSCPFEG